MSGTYRDRSNRSHKSLSCRCTYHRQIRERGGRAGSVTAPKSGVPRGNPSDIVVTGPLDAIGSEGSTYPPHPSSHHSHAHDREPREREQAGPDSPRQPPQHGYGADGGGGSARDWHNGRGERRDSRERERTYDRQGPLPQYGYSDGSGGAGRGHREGPYGHHGFGYQGDRDREYFGHEGPSRGGEREGYYRGGSGVPRTTETAAITKEAVGQRSMDRVARVVNLRLHKGAHRRPLMAAIHMGRQGRILHNITATQHGPSPQPGASGHLSSSNRDRGPTSKGPVPVYQQGPHHHTPHPPSIHRRREDCTPPPPRRRLPQVRGPCHCHRLWIPCPTVAKLLQNQRHTEKSVHVASPTQPPSAGPPSRTGAISTPSPYTAGRQPLGTGTGAGVQPGSGQPMTVAQIRAAAAAAEKQQQGVAPRKTITCIAQVADKGCNRGK
ncbi:hypothetical protein Vretifemale_17899 [Volvox reticuliferus]|uniref:Uncharacterized protein n=1 Tax=Volvox reticuliferus TaxID=1737510 RepID=A0A8J4CW88_9CHLO|nr:hypothetical protein Vretifemale_17899 [Volvox reticuliferus]